MMSKELADITIELTDIEDVDWDAVEEYLQDHRIKYKVIKSVNQRTELTYESEAEKWSDYWINVGMDRARGIYDTNNNI